jgi:hypothetical protein
MKSDFSANVTCIMRDTVRLAEISRKGIDDRPEQMRFHGCGAKPWLRVSA